MNSTAFSHNRRDVRMPAPLSRSRRWPIASFLIVVSVLATLTPSVLAAPATPAPATGQPGASATAGEAPQTGAQPVPTPAGLPMLAWRVATGGAVTSPAVGDGVAFIASEDGYVYAVAIADGTVRWRFKAGKVVRSSPAVADGSIYAGDEAGILHALDAASGQERWQVKTGGPV